MTPKAGSPAGERRLRTKAARRQARGVVLSAVAGASRRATAQKPMLNVNPFDAEIAEVVRSTAAAWA